MPNRLTVHSRSQRRRFAELQYNMRRVVQKELLWLWRSVRGKLERTRLQMVNDPPVSKEYTIHHGVWEDFQDRLNLAMMDVIMVKGLEILRAEVDSQFAMGVVEFEYDYMAFISQYAEGLAKQIKLVTETTQSFVADRIAKWYKTPGETIQRVVNDLKGLFGLSRAELIAQTEITRLNSSMQSGLADILGIEEWWWETRRDQLVCTNRMVGPDGNVYRGCRGLHGKVFKMTNKMPPDGSHPGCRCGPKLMRLASFSKAEQWERTDGPKTMAAALRVKAAHYTEKMQARNERIVDMARKHFTSAVTNRLVPLIDKGRISKGQLAKLVTTFEGNADPREGFNKFVAAIRLGVTVDNAELNRILLNARNRYYQKLAKADWEEGKHPRDKGGEFTAGQGDIGGKVKSKPLETSDTTWEDPNTGEDIPSFTPEDIKRHIGDFPLDPDLIREAFNVEDEVTGITATITLFHGGQDNSEKPNDGSWFCNSTLRNKDGEDIGHMKRYIKLRGGEIEVEHTGFMTEEGQGEGFGRRVIQHSEQVYMKMGVKRIKLLADSDVGGYAWARMGYDFSSSKGWKDMHFKVGLALADIEHKLEPEEYRKAKERLDGFRHSWEFAMFEVGGIQVGKETMKGSRWKGEKKMDPKDIGYQIGEAYYGT